jgi:hypothetical protein
MHRRNRIITVAALAASALPASAMAQESLPTPDERNAANNTGQVVHAPKAGTQRYHSADALDAAKGRGIYETDETTQSLGRTYGSPDGLDAAKGGDSVAGRAPLGRIYGSPDASDAARDLPPAQSPAPTVGVRELPSSGFDWGDAGIGAAGMLALFGIAGSTLLVTGRRRRRGLQVATH